MNPTIIKDIRARKILDSRGNWTIEIEVITEYGFGTAAAPSGASTGKHEVVAFPENDVDKAIAEVGDIVAPELIGMDAEEQDVVDEKLKKLDGTKNFANIGGNTAVAISLANSKAAASSYGLPLFMYLGGNFATEVPYPLGNIVGGGAHAKNSTDIQEFHAIPIGAENIEDAIYANALVHKEMKKSLTKGGSAGGKGDEGAWAAALTNEEVLDLLTAAAEKVGAETGVEVGLGLDVAASEFWDSTKKKYIYERGGKELTTGEQVDYMVELIDNYNLYYVEDPMDEEDFKGFGELTKKADCLICGDDLYTTNTKRIEIGIEKTSTNSVLIKPNQIGTLTDTYKAVRMAHNHDLVPVISHRSGETPDETISHLAVAFSCPIIKTGAVGGERTAKLNELIRISEELDQRASMAKLP